MTCIELTMTCVKPTTEIPTSTSTREATTTLHNEGPGESGQLASLATHAKHGRVISAVVDSRIPVLIRRLTSGDAMVTTPTITVQRDFPTITNNLAATLTGVDLYKLYVDMAKYEVYKSRRQSRYLAMLTQIITFYKSTWQDETTRHVDI